MEVGKHYFEAGAGFVAYCACFVRGWLSVQRLRHRERSAAIAAAQTIEALNAARDTMKPW